jgi:hypothetical protein
VLLHKWEKDKKLNILSDETGTLYISIYINISFLRKINHITFIKWGSEIYTSGSNTLQDAQSYLMRHMELKKLRTDSTLHLLSLEKFLFPFNFSTTSHIITLYGYGDESVTRGMKNYERQPSMIMMIMKTTTTTIIIIQLIHFNPFLY